MLSSVSKRERERESGEEVRETTFAEGQNIIFSVLKVPRQCPPALLVEAMHMIGINFSCMALGGLRVKHAV
jgi:hypothetical protein